LKALYQSQTKKEFFWLSLKNGLEVKVVLRLALW
jgi:hypothetical protein